MEGLKRRHYLTATPEFATIIRKALICIGLYAKRSVVHTFTTSLYSLRSVRRESFSTVYGSWIISLESHQSIQPNYSATIIPEQLMFVAFEVVGEV